MNLVDWEFWGWGQCEVIGSFGSLMSSTDKRFDENGTQTVSLYDDAQQAIAHIRQQAGNIFIQRRILF